MPENVYATVRGDVAGAPTTISLGVRARTVHVTSVAPYVDAVYVASDCPSVSWTTKALWPTTETVGNVVVPEESVRVTTT